MFFATVIWAVALLHPTNQVELYAAFANEIPALRHPDFDQVLKGGSNEKASLSKSAQWNQEMPSFLAQLRAKNDAAVLLPPGPDDPMAFDKLAKVKGIAKECRRRSDYAAKTGDNKTAALICIESMRMARIITKNAPSVQQLVGIAVQSIAVRSIEQFATGIPGKEAELLQAEADAQMDTTSFGISLAIRSKWLRAELAKMSVDDIRRMFELKDLSDAEIKKLLPLAIQREEEYVADLSRVSSREGPDVIDQLVRLTNDVLESKDPVDMLAAWHGGMRSTFLGIVQGRTLTRVAWLYAAVNRYRDAHKRLPNRLSDVVQSKRLHEPFTGLEFTYEMKGKSFKIELPECNLFEGKIGLRVERTAKYLK